MSTFQYGMKGEAFNTALNQLDVTLRADVLAGKKLAVLGDSQDGYGWVNVAAEILQLSSVINVAKSGARYHDSVGTTIDLATYESTPDTNVLSNQVRRLIQDSFALGQQLTWTHPITGYVTSIDIGKGVGLGLTPPDVIYIKMGQNGSQGALSGADFDTAITTTYGDLDRYNQYTAIRWAVETLNIVFPHVPVFLGTPLNTLAANGSTDFLASYKAMKIKSDLTIEMAYYLNCPIIDFFNKMGINRSLEPGKYLGVGDLIHPSSAAGIQLMGRFSANEMRNQYVSRV